MQTTTSLKVQLIPTYNGSIENGYEPQEVCEGAYIDYYIPENNTSLYIDAVDIPNWENGKTVPIWGEVGNSYQNSSCCIKIGEFTKSEFVDYVKEGQHETDPDLSWNEMIHFQG